MDTERTTEQEKVRCPGYHNGHASSRSTEGDRCVTCGGHKPPIKALACDCEPTFWDDGSVSHEDDCDLAPWCPHEMSAMCPIPCGCRCDGCLALTEAHSLFRIATVTPPGSGSTEEGD